MNRFSCQYRWFGALTSLDNSNVMPICLHLQKQILLGDASIVIYLVELCIRIVTVKLVDPFLVKALTSQLIVRAVLR